MDKKTFDSHKTIFENLTGKNANDNLQSFFSYLNLLVSMDIKDRLSTLVENDKKKLSNNSFNS